LLRWLAHWTELQTIVVEQDTAPRLDPSLPSAMTACFAYNPGSFNKSWGFNIAARLAQRAILIVGDADVVAAHTLVTAVERCRDGVAAVKPYRRMIDLTSEESARVRAGEWSFTPPRPAGTPPSREAKNEYVVFAGGLFVIQRDVYLRIGGFDERFRGWGGEDDAMSVKLRRAQIPMAEIDKEPALHLWHPRSRETTLGQPHYEVNARLLADYDAYSEAELTRLCEVSRQTMGHLHKYRPSE
jgi:GT2 family glycosyltransferase